MADSKIKPIHEDIPTDRAWQTGRRIYLRCGYESTLGKQLRKLHATWDRDQRCLWVGSGKRAQVVPLALAAQERIRAIEAIKAAGRWVWIDFNAVEIRQRAAELDGVWDNDRKMWAMPDDESYREIRAAVTQRDEIQQRERAEREQARRQQIADARQADREAAQQEAAQRRERLIAASGRTLTGETTNLREISTRRMNKQAAHAEALPLGSVMSLPDGRRGIITGVKIWFTNSEFASSTCWHPETHDAAHWDWDYTVEMVEPTQDEIDQDNRDTAEQADADAIHELVDNASQLTCARVVDQFTAIPDADRVGTISGTAGSFGTVPFRIGTLILTRDDRVVWQHPGWHDDYISTEGISTAPELVERVRALLALGGRERTVYGQLPHYYKVRP